MPKTAKRQTLMNAIKTKFDLDCVAATQFYGRESTGIWIKDDVSRIGYSYPESPCDEAHPLNVLVSSKGWYVSPYDAETMMLHMNP
jgi:hypothetical protein